HLPWFRMADPYVTREMRIRDLLVHRSGLSLGAGDLLYWPATTYTTREVVERLADVPLTGGFRERYAYDNILYAVAQLVIEQASGQSFRQFLQQRIFDPLSMAATRYNADHLQPGDKTATGHARADFKHLGPTPNLTWDNASGAGGLYSSVNDLSRWMRLQLRGGIIDGEGDNARRLFPEARQRAMFSLITPIPIRPPAVPELAPATPQFLGYGEGWMVSDYRGERLVWHTGGWPGQVSRLTLVPGRNAGVVVLTNQEVGAAFNAITMDALDLLLGHDSHDWLGAYAAAVDKAATDADARWNKLQAERDSRSRPSLRLARYAGTYRDPWYGDVVIRQGARGLEVQFARTAQLLGDLEHWQHDSFVVRWRDRGLNADAFLTFALKPDGTIREARMEAISPLTDFSFDFQDLRLVPVE
ncbi:MAG: serine hydrolase, partial [Pseudoxanthomonas suwonensis]|nr:serine hydrolase [Pseudoxanthomonas suwonensis]